MVTTTKTNVENQLKQYGKQQKYILQILRNIQLSHHRISQDDIEQLSEALDLAKMKIQSKIDFYRFLHNSYAGDYEIYFSNSITDQMLGSEKLIQLLCELLFVKLGVTREDNRVTDDTTSCTGLCEQGPAMLINGYAIGNLDVERIKKIAALVSRGIPLEKWPQEWFMVADTIREQGPLLATESVPGEAIRKALQLGPEGVIGELEKSGLRGCGGAGFPTHMKWNIARTTAESERYVVCNADEGEPGTFKDRTLLNQYADTVLDGMTVCAATINAKQGFIYLRHEYHFLLEKLQQKLQQRRDRNLLGNKILGQDGFDFDIEIIMGVGSYVCGEESALIESLQGMRGIPRIRPPFPVTNGYFNKPTVVNNVETYGYAARILEHGPDLFSKGGNSIGWKILSISGDCEKPGIYEIPLGISIEKILNKCKAKDTQAVQVGGAGGSLVSSEQFFKEISFDEANTGGSFIIFNASRDMFDRAVNFTHFFAHESCGFCTPCRVGTKLMAQMADKVKSGHGAHLDIKEIHELSHLMTQASHCGLGQRAAVPMLETYQKFPESFRKRLTSDEYQPSFDVEAAIQRAKQIIADQETGN
jgi:[NiFe] hydrogenase diaphorase moiety large subunit